MQAKIGVVTVSDRASRGEYQDLGGPAIVEYLSEILTCDWAAETRLVADEKAAIESGLRELADGVGCSLIVTTGGHGPSAHIAS